jgi:hypothetical protein
MGRQEKKSVDRSEKIPSKASVSQMQKFNCYSQLYRERNCSKILSMICYSYIVGTTLTNQFAFHSKCVNHEIRVLTKTIIHTKLCYLFNYPKFFAGRFSDQRGNQVANTITYNLLKDTNTKCPGINLTLNCKITKIKSVLS